MGVRWMSFTWAMAIACPSFGWIAGCGAKTEAPVTPTAPPSASVVEIGPAPEQPADPNVVRCGVDDRPRSVVSTREPLSPEDRLFLGDRVAPEAGAAARRAPPRPAPTPTPVSPMPTRPPPMKPSPPQEDVTAVDPVAPMTIFERGAPRRADGGPLASAIADALQTAPMALDSCQDLVTDADRGEHALLVELASSGAPMNVRESAVVQGPSPFVRCAMERVCQLHAPAGEALKAILPLRVRIDRPIPPPMPPDPPPVLPPIPVDVTLGGARASAMDDVSVIIRSRVRDIASSCVAGKKVSRGAGYTMTIRWATTSTDGTSAPASMKVSPQGDVTPQITACIAQALHGIAFPMAHAPKTPVTVNVAFVP